MGKYNQGILGPFRGKVGTVIGSFWKGRWTMRGLTTNTKNPNTPAQQLTRAKFAYIAKLAAANLPFIETGMRQVAEAYQISPYNAAIGINFDNGFLNGTPDALVEDWTLLDLSYGQLLNPENPAAAQGTGNSLDITWTDNSGISPEVLGSDIIAVAIYNTSRNRAVFDLTTASRAASALNLTYPALWSGDTAQVFLFARSADGQLIANTAYLGAVTLA